MKVVVSWSGGKDSQACLIWACEKFGAKNIVAVFCDTGWEHKSTYKHVNIICEVLGVELIILKSDKYDGFIDMAIKRGRYPSAKRRFCTEKLKIEPMIDWVLKQKDNLLIIQGIRKDESLARSVMLDQCRYFKFYFEPHSSNTMIIERLTLKMQKDGSLDSVNTEKLNKAKSRLRQGKEDFKYHSYRKKEIIDWCSRYSDDILRPIFNWTGQATIAYSLDNNIPLNPLYYTGRSRVGCWPCIMCTKEEFDFVLNNDPDRIEEIRKGEKDSGSTFFAPNFVPVRYQRKRTPKGKKYADLDDVISYMRDRKATGNLFEDQDKENEINRRCMSAYSICE